MKKNNANQPRRLAETPESSKDGFWPCTIRYRARASQNDDTLSHHFDPAPGGLVDIIKKMKFHPAIGGIISLLISIY